MPFGSQQQYAHGSVPGGPHPHGSQMPFGNQQYAYGSAPGAPQDSYAGALAAVADLAKQMGDNMTKMGDNVTKMGADVADVSKQNASVAADVTKHVTSVAADVSKHTISEFAKAISERTTHATATTDVDSEAHQTPGAYS